MPLPTIYDEIDRLFDELISRPWQLHAQPLVPVELHETEEGWMVELPVEGLGAADLRIEVRGRRLSVSGRRQRKSATQQRSGSWVHKEEEAAFYRAVTLPVAVRPEDIEATIKDGILSIKIRRP